MLVKLYEIPFDWNFLAEQAAKGIVIRKPLGGEKHFVVDWVRANFGDVWSGEADQSFANRPLSLFIAVQGEQLIGFACYDATALGLFGPTGVLPECRGQGTGKALLLACMLDMRLKGYGYAIIGYIGPGEFYRKAVGAVEIPDSTPSLWKGMLWRE